MDGGGFVAKVLQARGVRFLFTLCGGHISPILVRCKDQGIRVVDVRHEATAVFAADAVSRLTGVPGVAAVTAGPGVTNTITAVKNAQLAQSPLILLGGATATVLRNRGSLQDIDQMTLMRPHVKWAVTVRRARNLVTTLEKAFRIAEEGVPGPVFVELPVDLLYPPEVVREWYGIKGGDLGGSNLTTRLIQWYLKRHLRRLFAGVDDVTVDNPDPVTVPRVSSGKVRTAAALLRHSEKPVLVIGSQSLLAASHADELAAAVEGLSLPVYLSGMARGLLGKDHPLQLRHKRKMALREADLVILAGVPCDFRLDYGNHISRKAQLISVNRDRRDLKKNRRPNLSILGDPASFLHALGQAMQNAIRSESAAWLDHLRLRDRERNREISQQAGAPSQLLNPLNLCRELEDFLDENSILVADGGDFVATTSYTVQPRRPLSWLDPGVFGTLGVGAGFALGAALCRPNSHVWLIYGDGSCAYSLAEFDSFVRHGLGVIALVGNDACWSQIARDQIDILKDDVGTVLRHTDYHRAARGFGGEGFLLDRPEAIEQVFQKARAAARLKKPVLINALLSRSDFRKGSISM